MGRGSWLNLLETRLDYQEEVKRMDRMDMCEDLKKDLEKGNSDEWDKEKERKVRCVYLDDKSEGGDEIHLGDRILIDRQHGVYQAVVGEDPKVCP